MHAIDSTNKPLNSSSKCQAVQVFIAAGSRQAGRQAGRQADNRPPTQQQQPRALPCKAGKTYKGKIEGQGKQAAAHMAYLAYTACNGTKSVACSPTKSQQSSMHGLLSLGAAVAHCHGYAGSGSASAMCTPRRAAPTTSTALIPPSKAVLLPTMTSLRANAATCGKRGRSRATTDQSRRFLYRSMAS